MVLAAIVLASGSVGFSQTGASGIRSVDFLNHSYQSSVCSEDLDIGPTVKVSKGKFSQEENFYNVYENRIIYGDINGDGQEDALVQISCGSSAGSLRAFEAHVFTYQNGGAKLLARIDSRSVESAYKKIYPQGFVVTLAGDEARIANGKVFVGAYTDGSNAGPKYISTFSYKLAGDKLVITGKPARKLNK